ncbi:MAG: hypothetical protein A4E60_00218 [Syntrophorhabdus sp. PtaB.Bin047]|jgi:hypothetical protein|nr:MAG: hypothetical protein A4E60_00218 [Syntrophorhabdus sp. PtaB.Bin047]
MGFYINEKFGYYQGDRIDPGDQEVPERPSPHYSWVNGVWQFSREAWLNAGIRPERDRLLDEVDLRYCNAERWEGMTTEQKTAWKAYKQALRDLPATIDYANQVWPEMPA